MPEYDTSKNIYSILYNILTLSLNHIISRTSFYNYIKSRPEKAQGINSPTSFIKNYNILEVFIS